ncbi:DNA polymerase IV [Apibacter adventoris]|uniref:DNA polymerase IV n=1 Tax=Apibacter adventoris TaxID=1679466 RepID=UPI000CF70A1F|nr:DNA polymerase IV [Apibacter adventoris]PQL93318.1 DNA polymerase IV [Apibacter adventoris]
MRKIIHIDMDAFFASIEQRDNEEYRGKPLAVGYSGERGVVAAASYEARKYGVRSAMSSKLAQQKCPELIFAPSRFEVYKKVSQQIRDIFFQYTDLVEPLSLDEAFLDVTQNHKNMEFAMDIAKEIKEKILLETSLTASAGVSFNKFLAKIASDYNKPNGLFIITPQKSEKFIEKLTIEKFFGIGKKTAEKMHRLGINTGWDLKQKTEEELINWFGKIGKQYYLNARGKDNREVNPNRIRKSVGAENTFMYDTDSLPKLYKELGIIAQEVIQRVKKSSFKGKTVTLKIKYSDFKLISKSKTHITYINEYTLLYKIALELLSEVELYNKVRLIGLSIKNSKIKTEQFIKEGYQFKIPFKEFK